MEEAAAVQRGHLDRHARKVSAHSDVAADGRSRRLRRRDGPHRLGRTLQEPLNIGGQEGALRLLGLAGAGLGAQAGGQPSALQNKRLAERFLESVESADTSVCATHLRTPAAARGSYALILLSR